jgi:hypothetical protein
MKTLKIRCSAIGKLMATPRSKSELLSQTAKTYIHELVLEHKYGIKKEFSSRYTDKGNAVEDESILLVNDVLNVKFIYKNEEHFTNDWITGTPDVNTEDVLLDVKSLGMLLPFRFLIPKFLTRTTTISFRVICGSQESNSQCFATALLILLLKW